jgi:hypothetical protein
LRKDAGRRKVTISRAAGDRVRDAKMSYFDYVHVSRLQD